MRADEQTDRHAHRNTPHPDQGVVTNVLIIMITIYKHNADVDVPL